MSKYYLEKLSNDQLFLVCIDYNSILNYLNEVEKEVLLQSNEGEIIIDQLLVAGNGNNRFISCQFSCGEIKLETAKNIEGIRKYKQISTNVLKEYLNLLKYTILTDTQIELISQGQIV